MIYLNLVCWSSSSPSPIFFLDLLPQWPFMGCLVWCLHELIELSCRFPLTMIRSSPLRLPCSDLSVIEPWWLHLDQYTLKVIYLYLKTNINFLVVFFIFMPPPNSIDSTASSSSGALESWTNTISSDTICCNWNWYALIPVVACVTRDTILTIIPIVGDTEIPHWWPQARHEIGYLKHTRWILKHIWRRTHNLMWFDPNLTYIYKERTWESFIKKLVQRDLTFLLMTQEYSSSPWTYA